MSAAPPFISGLFFPLSSPTEEKQSPPSPPPKFSAPAHPSVHLLEKLRLEKVAGKEEKNDSLVPSSPPPYVHRDPHEQPTFTSESLAHPIHPILYLPPLISSLPSGSAPEYQASAFETESGKPAVLTTSTRLPEIDPVSLSLHRALHYFRPLDDRYASKSYAEAFNWDELKLPEEEEREWYCVAFRSRRKEGSNGDALYEADRKAHEEAVQNGGLLMYWYGVPDPTTGLNLATCIWQSRAHASAANSRPDHIRAMRLARDSYEVYTLERHVLRKRQGTKGVVVETYTDGPVGW